MTARFGHRHLDVACSLDATAGDERLAAWQRLRHDAGLGSERLDGGVRLWLADAVRVDAERLAAAEAACCGFLDLEVGPSTGGRFSLDVTSPRPDALPVIVALLGDPQA